MRRCALIVVATLMATGAFGQDAGKKPSRDLPAFRFDAGVELPIETERKIFSPFGLTTGLDAAFPLAFIRPVYLDGKLDFSYLPLRADNQVLMTSVALGAGYAWELAPRLKVRFKAAGGFYAGSLGTPAVDPETQTLYDNQSGYGGFLYGGVGAEFFMSPAFSLGLQAGYSNYLGLGHGVRIGACAVFNLEGLSSNVVLKPSDAMPLFPALAKSYEKLGTGTLEISNRERFPIQDVSVTYQINGVMYEPTVCLGSESIPPGGSRTIDLLAILGEGGMRLTSDGLYAADIKVKYKLNGKSVTLVTSRAVTVFNRNAMTWDDDRKVAAFVNTKDPDVLVFAKAVSGIAQDPSQASINLNFRLALALYEALGEYRLSYIRDPKTPAYADASKSETILDFLQYPRQTLKFRGGDCDDLSILYVSLMEAIGIESAFITVPGHIYAALSLDIPSGEIRKVFGSEQDFIFIDGKAWLPVEITMVGGNFADAWKTGATEWREAYQIDAAKLYPVEEAWKTWECAGSPSDVGAIPLLDIGAVALRYQKEIASFIARQIDAQVAPLLAAIEKNPLDAKSLNRLGIIYGGYGRADQAEVVFKRAWTGSQYLPSLANLGTLYLLQERLPEAISAFEQVFAQAPKNGIAVAGLAKAYKLLGEQRKVDNYMAILQSIDGGLAASLAHLSTEGQGTRASGAMVHSALLWASDDE